MSRAKKILDEIGFDREATINHILSILQKECEENALGQARTQHYLAHFAKMLNASDDEKIKAILAEYQMADAAGMELNAEVDLDRVDRNSGFRD